jgi:hypothetical protein
MSDNQLLFNNLDSFLVGKGWRSNSCAACGNAFYLKSQSDCCQDLNCNNGYSFLSLPSRGYSLPPEVFSRSVDFFSAKGVIPHPAKNLISGGGGTLFVIAGVQILEETLFQDQTPPDGVVYVAQPCFRTQFLKSIDDKTIDSCYAFVNLVTEEVNGNFDSFLTQVDNWLGFLSKSGFYAGNIALVPRVKISDWGTGEFSKLVISFNYGGLQLGTASYCPEVPTRGGNKVSISDIGFGLERITWAMNKTPDIHDSLETGIGGAGIDKVKYDLIRTLTLLSLSGVEPSNHDQGYRLRFLAKRYVAEKFGEDVPERYLTVAYDYWKNFVDPVNGIDTTRFRINMELQSHFNAEILRELGLTPSEKVSELTTSELGKVLLSRGIEFDRLKQAVLRVKNV